MHLGALGRLAVGPLVAPANSLATKKVSSAVVDHHMDYIREPGLVHQRGEDLGDGFFPVVCRNDAGDARPGAKSFLLGAPDDGEVGASPGFSGAMVTGLPPAALDELAGTSLGSHAH